jgi:uncharacterized protein YecE (DUF72 family)
MTLSPTISDPLHDPGIDAAKERAERALSPDGGAARVRLGGVDVLFGTASWTDPTLIAPGVFYPDGVASAEARLRYYASRFSMVEVDSSYYALPTPRMAELWVERTPDDFLFDIKAYALMTGHAAETDRFPRVVKEALPPECAKQKRVYARDLPPDVRDEVWQLFADAVQPLHDAGKLGAVLLQYPRWVRPGPHTAEMLARARSRLGDLPISVEFRHREWLAPSNRDRTFALLREHDMSYVTVDEPQGLESSVPPELAVTSPRLALFRFHGRRGDMWEKPGATVLEKYRYLYDASELASWVPRIEEAAAAAKQVHVVFNNCYGNYGTTNALEMRGIVARAG